jgi:hypothetical protein
MKYFVGGAFVCPVLAARLLVRAESAPQPNMTGKDRETVMSNCLSGQAVN